LNALRTEKVDFRVLVRVAPERVFDAIATADGLNGWFTQGSELEQHKDGRLLLRFKDYGLDSYTGDFPGKVLEWQRPQRYSFQWEADSRGYFTTVEIDIAPTEEGTIVHLIEHGYKDTPSGLQDLLNRASGWAAVLTQLKYYLEHGVRY
jgi:uncharacterized protein YndB with AHSA1/START domain